MDSLHSQSHWHFGMYLSCRKNKIKAIESFCCLTTRAAALWPWLWQRTRFSAGVRSDWTESEHVATMQNNMKQNNEPVFFTSCKMKPLDQKKKKTVTLCFNLKTATWGSKLSGGGAGAGGGRGNNTPGVRNDVLFLQANQKFKGSVSSAAKSTIWFCESTQINGTPHLAVDASL